MPNFWEIGGLPSPWLCLRIGPRFARGTAGSSQDPRESSGQHFLKVKETKKLSDTAHSFGVWHFQIKKQHLTVQHQFNGTAGMQRQWSSNTPNRSQITRIPLRQLPLHHSNVLVRLDCLLSRKLSSYKRSVFHVGASLLKYMNGICAGQVPCQCTSGLVNLAIDGHFSY